MDFVKAGREHIKVAGSDPKSRNIDRIAGLFADSTSKRRIKTSSKRSRQGSLESAKS